MNRIVKVHERISPGFLTPFIFILSLTFEDKYIKGQGPGRLISALIGTEIRTPLILLYGKTGIGWSPVRRPFRSAGPARSVFLFRKAFRTAVLLSGFHYTDFAGANGLLPRDVSPVLFRCRCPYYTGKLKSAPVNPIPQLFYL